MNLKLLALLCVISWSCNAPESDKAETKAVATADEKKDEWESLSGNFKAKWHSYGKDSLGKAWKVEDSVLHLDASVKDDWQTKDGGDIVTNNEYENFDLKLEWKISKGGNSGIMFYVKEDSSKYKYSWETGPEIQVTDNENHPDGKNPLTSAGALYDLVPASTKNVKPAGEWNAAEIIANKGKLDLYMNGELVSSTTLWDDHWKKMIASTKFKDMKDFGTFKKGKISLQDHGADVWFRNIKIKSL